MRRRLVSKKQVGRWVGDKKIEVIVTLYCWRKKKARYLNKNKKYFKHSMEWKHSIRTQIGNTRVYKILKI